MVTDRSMYAWNRVPGSSARRPKLPSERRVIGSRVQRRLPSARAIAGEPRPLLPWNRCTANDWRSQLVARPA